MSVTGQQFATILARTDPFDVAQALERFIRSLPAPHVREMIAAARPRMNDWYSAEFMPLLDETNDERMKQAFAATLKSNLRAISLFGSAFCEGVIANIPADRAVGLGEERRSWPARRPAAIAAAAIAVLLGGAAIDHVVSIANATAQTPAVLSTPIAVLPHAVDVPRARHARTVKRRPSAPVHLAVAAAAPVRSATVRYAPVQYAPVQTAPAPSAVRPAPAGSGEKTVVVRQTPQPSPSPQNVDVSDMPQSYSDATPLPNDQTPPQARVEAPLTVPTPTPAPNRSWTHRIVHAAVHLVNSTLGIAGKDRSTPTPPPAGPRP
ncbi:MAG TPA: hypothetical protein VIO32_09495 [Candidatus Baltobacteraceae bacterium]